MPWRLCIGEDADEGLLSIKDPRKGDKNGLEELCAIEFSDAVFDCGVEGRMMMFLR